MGDSTFPFPLWELLKIEAQLWCEFDYQLNPSLIEELLDGIEDMIEQGVPYPLTPIALNENGSTYFEMHDQSDLEYAVSERFGFAIPLEVALHQVVELGQALGATFYISAQEHNDYFLGGEANEDSELISQYHLRVARKGKLFRFIYATPIEES